VIQINNLQKMNEILEASYTKEQMLSWAEHHRIFVCFLEDDEEFYSMTESISSFMNSEFHKEWMDEFTIWRNFLDAEYVFSSDKSTEDNADIGRYTKIIQELERLKSSLDVRKDYDAVEVLNETIQRLGSI